eukprot:6347351-Pyramimonas_sp.AAC.1
MPLRRFPLFVLAAVPRAMRPTPRHGHAPATGSPLRAISSATVLRGHFALANTAPSHWPPTEHLRPS